MCKHAIRKLSDGPIICLLTNNACKHQKYCHRDCVWQLSPAVGKCENFESKK